jgi:membrane dipeptidase
MRTFVVTLLLTAAATSATVTMPTLQAQPKPAARSAASSTQTSQPLKNADLATRLAHVREHQATTPLVDGHNDLPWYIRERKTNPRDVPAYDLTTKTTGMTDIPRLRQGQVGAQFWSVYVPGEVKDSGYARIQLEEIDIARQIIARYPKDLKLVTTAAELRAAHKSGRIASLLGMEGGHAIENSLGALRAYYDLGARYMTLTHNVTLDWADAALDAPKHGGLTPFGREVVREMNRLGMLVDLSHVSPGVMSNALDVTESPVIFSHSSARALTNVPRNVPDSILRRLPKNGGVVMVAFVTGFVSQKVADYGTRATLVRDSLRKAMPSDTAAQTRAMDAWTRANPSPHATLSDVADHMDHIRQVAGAAHVGVGSDFDGITDTVVGLEDVSKFPDLLAELMKRGWTDTEIRGVAGENVLRVLTRAEAVSARLRRTRPASTATIDQMDGKRGI